MPVQMCVHTRTQAHTRARAHTRTRTHYTWYNRNRYVADELEEPFGYERDDLKLGRFCGLIRYQYLCILDSVAE